MEKKGKKLPIGLIAIAGIVVIAAGVLIVSLAKNIGSMATKVKFPESYITESAREWPKWEGNDALKEEYTVHGVEFVIDVPGKFLGDMCEANDITYYITYNEQGDKILESLLDEHIPTQISGKASAEYEEMVREKGYFCDREAMYIGGVVESPVGNTTVVGMKESVRFHFIVSYVITFNDCDVIICAATRNKEKLVEAEDMIRNIALSIEPSLDIYNFIEENTQGEVSEDVKEDAEEEELLYPFYLPVENKEKLENGVCIVRWSNYAIPEVIEVVYSKGMGVSYDEEYSSPDEYVFMMGPCEPGDYAVSGETSVGLKNVEVYFMELETYLAKLEERENPIIIPRGDE